MTKKDLYIGSDPSLVDKLRTGSAEAFETIYRRYSRELYNYARKHVPTPEDCDEIIQNTFVQVWTRRETLPENLILAPYLFTMVRYSIVRYIQHSKSKKRYADHFRLFAALYEEPTDPIKSTVTLYDMLEQGIADLPARCGDAVKLRFIENLTNAEVAKRLNISKRSVANYITEALKHFRKMAREGKLPRPVYALLLVALATWAPGAG